MLAPLEQELRDAAQADFADLLAQLRAPQRALAEERAEVFIEQLMMKTSKALAATVRLRDYDVLLVNSSAGKDSQAMLDEVVRRAEAEGVKERVIVVHADLGDVEWEGTTELAGEQAAAYGCRIEYTRRTQGGLLEHVVQRGKWPDSARRYCTSDHKRGPIRRVMTRLADEVRYVAEATVRAGRIACPPAPCKDKFQWLCEMCEGAAELPADRLTGASLPAARLAEIRQGAPVRILNCMGLRAEESRKRAGDLPYVREEDASNGRRLVDTWLPIHDWTTAEVWARIKASGVRYHKAYDLGMPRLSCAFCIFAPKDALLLAGKHNPKKLEQYVAVERLTGHKFKQKLALADIKAELDAGAEAGPVSAEGWTL